MKRNRLLIYVIIIILIFGSTLFISSKNGLFKKSEVKDSEIIKDNQEPHLETIEPEVVEKDLLISMVGDCTIGTDSNFSKSYNFNVKFAEVDGDYSYFFDGVKDVLSNDDISIANMEGVFTDYDVKTPKVYNFKGPAEYANIFTYGNVEIVNLANNHTYDYGEIGYEDTLKALEAVNLPYYGYDNYYIYEIKGLRIGFAGLTANMKDAEADVIKETKRVLDYLKEQNLDLIIMTYHWGIERDAMFNSKQSNIGHYAIDNGADLVIGHHPHVLQGIEEYNGKYIIYSLANFVFGGNNNPTDKDTMIVQENFHFVGSKLTDTTLKIIPASVSGKTSINDFRPIILEGSERKRVLKKVLDRSYNFEYVDSEEE